MYETLVRQSNQVRVAFFTPSSCVHKELRLGRPDQRIQFVIARRVRVRVVRFIVSLLFSASEQ